MALSLFVPLLVQAQPFQNLVLNGNFENYSQCPNTAGQISLALGWSGPTTNSSDFVHACSTSINVPYYGGVNFPRWYLPAKSGGAYVGGYTYHNLGNYREYLQGTLVDTLRAGNCYYVEFYAANSQSLKYASNNISLSFTSSAVSASVPVPGSVISVAKEVTNFGNPVLADTVKWHKISGIYQAVGNETKVLIGNFKNDANTDTVPLAPITSLVYIYAPPGAYIFVDSVSVYKINPTGALPWSYRDTTIAAGDSVFIGNQMGGPDFQPEWYNESGSLIKVDAGITVSPTITTNYIVQFTLCGVVRRDTVTVTVPQVSTLGISNNTLQRLSISPNPAGDELLITLNNSKAESLWIQFTDQFGQLVEEKTLELKSARCVVDLSRLSAGIYIVSIRNNNNEIVRKKLLVQK